MNCAAVAADISAYNEEWPGNANPKLFFSLIKNNLNLRSLSFCFVYIDSLPASIGKVKNLERLQLAEGDITSIPKEIGHLKKLKELIFGPSKDECGGSAITKVPKEIGQCEALETLGLAFSKITDLPDELKTFKKIYCIQ